MYDEDNLPLSCEEFDDPEEPEYYFAEQALKTCPVCGHANRHGEYGCEYERGDNLAGTRALPPCGCKG